MLLPNLAPLIYKLIGYLCSKTGLFCHYPDVIIKIIPLLKIAIMAFIHIGFIKIKRQH